MPNFKVDWIFHDKNRNRSIGWTESLYLINYQDHVAALGRAEATGLFRVMMLGNGVEMTSIRVSDLAIIGDSKVFPGLAPGATGTYNPAFGGIGGAAAVRADFPWSSLECRVDSGALYRRAYFLSGNPDGIQLDNDAKVVDPIWLNAFNAWADDLALAGNRFAFRVRFKDSIQAPYKTVTFYDAPSGLFTADGHGFIPGDLVSFLGGGFIPRITGRYRVATVPGPNSFTLVGFNRPETFIGIPKVQKVVYGLTAVTEVQQQYYGQKKRGGVSGAVRGRRPTR